MMNWKFLKTLIKKEIRTAMKCVRSIGYTRAKCDLHN